MMDAKYLAEIKARCEGDVPDIAAPVFRDRKALIAEVERLTDQHQCDTHNLEAMQTILDQQAKNCENLLAASLLRAIAAGEYKPVVHARWKLVSEGARCNLVKCTHCGRSIAVTKNVPLDKWRAAKPYCDQCGALMHKSDMGILQDGKDENHE